MVYKTIKKKGSYIVLEEQNLTVEKLDTTISIKLLVDPFKNIMNQLPACEVKVIEQKINTDDVNEEVIDIKARLESKSKSGKSISTF